MLLHYDLMIIMLLMQRKRLYETQAEQTQGMKHKQQSKPSYEQQQQV
jgi:hypothetical protein